jgi:hypothetical protein
MECRDEQQADIKAYIEKPHDMRMPNGARPPHDTDLPKCDRTHFLRVWKNHQMTKHITIRKYMRFSKCDTCVACRTIIPVWTVDRASKQRIRKETYREHLVCLI